MHVAGSRGDERGGGADVAGAAKWGARAAHGAHVAERRRGVGGRAGAESAELRAAAVTVDDRVLQGQEGARLTVGFFADSADPQVKRFVDAYKKRYAAQPSQLAAQAYDGAARQRLRALSLKLTGLPAA